MNYVTAGLVAFITLLGGFYGGYSYEAAKVPASTGSGAAAASTGAGAAAAAGAGAGRFGGAFGGGAGGAFAGRGGAGKISNLTATGFTLTTAAGTVTKVTFGSGVTVRKTVTGTTSDLQNGVTVTVTGQRDASGNLTATAVTLVPLPAASATPGG
ncbi:MAG TPA: hypothetical protein VNG93_12185 [Candidatus Dormibacteraeota bacterium]|nr:hypothetical protein [Candidatus Dormibacteraeota bacterium]